VAFSDADLIARVLLHDDEHAFAELVRRYQSPIRSFLLKMTNGDAHLADDLAQETFLKAWRRLDDFRGGSRFSTWLFSIAHNQWRMHARTRKETLLEELPEPPPEPETSDPSAHGRLRMDLAEALKSLTPAERAAIVLCCQNGLSHDEAAQALELPVGTVKTHILRGKEKLRRRLGV
jgi:RNA polymerase sigma factor (sigma-70 family)